MSTLLLRSRWLFEPAIAVLFFVFWAMALVGRHQLLPGMLRSTLPFWAALLLLAIAIGVSRLQPIVAMAVGTAVLIGQLLFPGGIFDEPVVYLGYGIVVLIVAASVRGRWRVVALAFAVGAGVSIAGLLAWWFGAARGDAGARTALFVLCGSAGAVAWLVGTLIGVWTRTRAIERELSRTVDDLRAAETEAMVTAERERIAQDVHDIMAHSLSVILAQADGARLLAEERPAAVAPSLATIASTARSSLTEVRVLIETLVGSPEGPVHPGLGDLDDLVGRMSASGLALTVERFGDSDSDSTRTDPPPALTPAQQLAAYRIVQEGLTNALKHAGPGASARLALDQRADGLALSLASRPRDDAATPASPPANPHGRGIINMRERARLAGGWLDAGPDDDVPGGFLITAYLPAGTRQEVEA
ncbi:histidine kinase [Leifsonia sp. F6_8S_P_1B]|uniref:histidine kinase n=1 Tax=Leifsonia williamsii TaxID=3035919 RepID=A0ABT8KD01_9MICO|nr:histidine kinase [Leifsonia williamsii]MDN4614887.1 histidine kinase [Leifsonia williamsii]